jgi:hypothetical protein
MKKLPPFRFDPVHVICCCEQCVYERLLKLLADLDLQFGPGRKVQPKKEVVQ